MTTERNAARAARIAEEDRDARTRPCPVCQQPKSGGRDLLCVECWKRLPRITVQLYHYVWKLKQATLIPDVAFAELERLVVQDAGGTAPRRSPLASTVAAAALVPSPRAGPIAGDTKVEIDEPPDPAPTGAPGRARSGSDRAVNDRARRRIILNLLPRLPGDALRAEEVATRAGMHPDTTKRILAALAGERLVRVQARATGKGRPPNYWWAA